MNTVAPIRIKNSPKRSSNRPKTKFPIAKPIIVIEYGNDVWLRSRLKSNSIAGIMVTIDHIPTLPTAAMEKIIKSLVHEALLSNFFQNKNLIL
jgi:uncharacterized protein (DUF1786 family)